jgi:hypothetical protein
MVFGQLDGAFSEFSERCSPIDAEDIKPYTLYVDSLNDSLSQLCKSLICYTISKEGDIKRLEDTKESELFFEIAANPSCSLIPVKRDPNKTIEGVREDLVKRGINFIEEEIQMLMATLSNAGCIEVHKTVKIPMSTAITDDPMRRRFGITAYTEICLIGVTRIPTMEIIV